MRPSSIGQDTRFSSWEEEFDSPWARLFSFAAMVFFRFVGMMVDLQKLHPVAQALLAATFMWGTTALGAATVLFFRRVNQQVLDAMLGFGAGIMIAVCYWGLLCPAIQISRAEGHLAWGPPVIGFLFGALLLWLIDKILPHLHPGFSPRAVEGVKTSWKRSLLIVLAVTLHNFPEGLAVGVAFGAVAAGLPYASLMSALLLTVGMAVQNIPEGVAVSLPLRRDGFSRQRSFWYGQLTGAVEPLGALVGVSAAVFSKTILPYALAFAAGAMFYVIVEELIPESQRYDDADLATLSTVLGFTVMMILEIAVGG